MDIEGVRTFVAVAEAGQFQVAAVDLHVTQQAVSKRVAALERSLGVPLFARTARGASLTLDGRAFLPHARGVLRAVDRAASSVRPGERALRVDVVHPRIAPAQLLRRFHRARPSVALDVVTLPGADAGRAVEALVRGEIDATFRAVLEALPPGVTAVRVLDDPLQVLAGPSHPLAGRSSLRPPELSGHRIWIPGIQPGHRVGGVLCVAGGHLRSPDRRAGTELRDRGADGGDRGIARGGHPGRQRRSLRLAGLVRPAPDSADRAVPGLSALVAVPHRQFPPVAGAVVDLDDRN